jgi:hypothetical protein
MNERVTCGIGSQTARGKFDSRHGRQRPVFRGIVFTIAIALQILPAAAQSPATDLGSVATQSIVRDQLTTPQANDLIPLYRGGNGISLFSRYSNFAGGSITAPIVVPMRTVTASGNITVSATTDYFICANLGTPAAIAVNLPATPATGLTFLIKDCSGTAATDNLTLTPAAGNIDGATTYVMSTNYASVAVTYNGVSWSVN